jgi:hypothetical protein
VSVLFDCLVRTKLSTAQHSTLHDMCDIRCSEAADLAVQQATKLLSTMAVDGGRLDLWLSAQVCWLLQWLSLRMQ